MCLLPGSCVPLSPLLGRSTSSPTLEGMVRPYRRAGLAIFFLLGVDGRDTWGHTFLLFFIWDPLSPHLGPRVSSKAGQLSLPWLLARLLPALPSSGPCSMQPQSSYPLTYSIGGLQGLCLGLRIMLHFQMGKGSDCHSPLPRSNVSPSNSPSPQILLPSSRFRSNLVYPSFRPEFQTPALAHSLAAFFCKPPHPHPAVVHPSLLRPPIPCYPP